jgi:hypothetical protein
VAREEYATLDELKSFITIDQAVVDRDDLLTIALDAAHDDVEGDCGRRFYLDDAASARTFDPVDRVVEDRGRAYLLIDDIGSLDDLTVETGSGSSWVAVSGTVEYRPENALARGRAITSLMTPSGIWPTDPFTRVRVTARWGWPAVPPRVKEATLLQASRLYARRKSPQGVVGTADWGQVNVRRSDPDYMRLIEGFVRPGFGGAA